MDNFILQSHSVECGRNAHQKGGKKSFATNSKCTGNLGGEDANTQWERSSDNATSTTYTFCPLKSAVVVHCLRPSQPEKQTGLGKDARCEPRSRPNINIQTYTKISLLLNSSISSST